MIVASRGNRTAFTGVPPGQSQRPEEDPPMKGIAAWLIGIPIPIIILLYLFDVF